MPLSNPFGRKDKAHEVEAKQLKQVKDRLERVENRVQILETQVKVFKREP